MKKQKYSKTCTVNDSINKYMFMLYDMPSTTYSALIPDPMDIGEDYKCKGKGRYKEYSRNTLTMPLLHSQEMVDYAFKIPARSNTKRLKGKQKCSVS